MSERRLSKTKLQLIPNQTLYPNISPIHPLLLYTWSILTTKGLREKKEEVENHICPGQNQSEKKKQ